METGMIAVLVVGSLLTTGVIAGIATTGGHMMQGAHMGGIGGHDGMHEECKEHMQGHGCQCCDMCEKDCEDWESWDQEEEEEHESCHMMG